ncbi:unnamed protein product [Oppiella nova]|uniref:Uncharacterized protein n=1 Tax=Oppiella nova TaxID=334625 RepID=A0A7R9QS53_9ACAR|nr:unnamed protein product [Oppiella nova]CAG2171929.1 unnamed protein product [Oppiella nova]
MMLDTVAAGEHKRGLEIWARWHDTISNFLAQGYTRIDDTYAVVVPQQQRAAFFQLLVNDITYIYTFFKTLTGK